MGGYVKILKINDERTVEICPLIPNIQINDVYARTSVRAFHDKKIEFTSGGGSVGGSTKNAAFSNLFVLPDIYFNGSPTYNSFMYCQKLLNIASIRGNIGPNFTQMFSHCESLLSIPVFDTSEGGAFDRMFFGCSKLKNIPQLNISNGTSFTNMFNSCSSLTTISKLICNSNKTSIMKNIFDGCYNLENITIEGTIKVDSNDLNLSYHSNLTVDSLMSFINAFEDNTGEEAQYTVTIGATNLAKLTEDQITVATNKNILLA